MDGSRLKEARRARNLTQAELGRLVGVGKSAISQYEHGLRLAGALGVSADWLLGIEDRRGTIAGEARTPYRTGDPPPEDEGTDGFLAELCARAGAIASPEDRRTLLEMARFLAQKGSSSEGPRRRPSGERTSRRRR